MNDLSVSETLNRAADRIGMTGHTKGQPFAGPDVHTFAGPDVHTAPACVIAALHVAADDGGGIRYISAREALRAYLGAFPVEWNDAPERTAAEVIATLRAAALIEAARENAETREAVTVA